LHLSINTGLWVGAIVILFEAEEEEEKWMCLKTAAKIIKSALIIPVFFVPLGKGSVQCHNREVHFELYVSLCL